MNKRIYDALAEAAEAGDEDSAATLRDYHAYVATLDPETQAFHRAAIRGNEAAAEETVRRYHEANRPQRPSADGGAGSYSPPLERSAAERFNEEIRVAAGHARGVPREQDITPQLEGGRG